MKDDERLENELPVEDIQIEDEEMSNTEITDEVEKDKEEVIEDEIEQPFYASNKSFDELRDVLPDLDYRLFLINDNIVVIGRLNGVDIEILVKANDEYDFIKAPATLEELKNVCNVMYFSPDIDKEEYEALKDKEANQEEVMSYLMNLLPDKSDEFDDADNNEEDKHDEEANHDDDHFEENEEEFKEDKDEEEE